MRLRALDGLRGVAAMIVVLHHSALLNAGVSDVYLDPTRPVVPGSFAAIVTRTPLQLLFSGEEAVLIFFVLSGLVVALPPLSRSDFSWLAYYPRRLIRLLLPVAAAVALSLIVISVSLHDPSTAPSGWAAGSSFARIDWYEAIRNVDVLIGGATYDNPLWSLRYELLFSVLLPLYVLVGALIGRRWWALALGLAAAIVVGATVQDPNWVYLPVFMFGTMMAARLADLSSLGRRKPAARGQLVLGIAAVLLGVVLLEARWELTPLRPGSQTVATAAQLLSVLGAALIVVVVVAWAPLGRALEVRPIQWLGRISFSLYLVHVPILIATAWFLRGLAWYWTPVVAIPAALLIAALFTRFVEGPSHRLSQRVGRAVARRLGPGSDQGTTNPPETGTGTETG
jgi:peptidoglycan/LPS O-acetylase OafA/YrhL